MTSLQHTVLGGYRHAYRPAARRGRDHGRAASTAAGWQTARLHLERLVRHDEQPGARGGRPARDRSTDRNSASSAELAGGFLALARRLSGRPYWVHFQTTDVHWPWEAVPPVGRRTFLERRGTGLLTTWSARSARPPAALGRSWGSARRRSELFEKAGHRPQGLLRRGPRRLRRGHGLRRLAARPPRRAR